MSDAVEREWNWRFGPNEEHGCFVSRLCLYRIRLCFHFPSLWFLGQPALRDANSKLGTKFDVLTELQRVVSRRLTKLSQRSTLGSTCPHVHTKMDRAVYFSPPVFRFQNSMFDRRLRHTRRVTFEGARIRIAHWNISLIKSCRSKLS